MPDWKRIYSTQKPHRAEMVRSILEEHGFQPVVVNKRDSSYPIGFFEVMVATEEVLKAKMLLNDTIDFE